MNNDVFILFSEPLVNKRAVCQYHSHFISAPGTLPIEYILDFFFCFRLHRMTSMEREEKEKVKKREKKLEDEEILQQATWVKYTIPIKHQVKCPCPCKLM